MYLLADLIIRIKNANIAKKETLEVPFSTFTKNVCTVLKNKGYLVDVKTFKEGNHKMIGLTLDEDNSVINDIKVVSKPGRRIYASLHNLKAERRNIGITLISTPKGILTKDEALAKKVGGEVLCKVF
jgi:small subunit ribosomal protein S8